MYVWCCKISNECSIFGHNVVLMKHDVCFDQVQGLLGHLDRYSDSRTWCSRWCLLFGEFCHFPNHQVGKVNEVNCVTWNCIACEVWLSGYGNMCCICWTGVWKRLCGLSVHVDCLFCCKEWKWFWKLYLSLFFVLFSLKTLLLLEVFIAHNVV